MPTILLSAQYLTFVPCILQILLKKKKKWQGTIRKYKMQCFDATLQWNGASGSSISTKGRVRSLDMVCNWLLRLNEETRT